MTTNSKLTKVLEYLIKNDEEKARELLHQVFIEKARAIHEDLMNVDDEEMQPEMEGMMNDDEMEEMVGGSGDEGQDMTDEIAAMEDEIDFEETMTEEDDDDDADMTGMPELDDVDMAGSEEADMEKPADEFSGMDSKIDQLEDVLKDLRAEFDRLEAEEKGESADEEGEEGEEEAEEEGEGEGEEEMEEAWDLDEDFDDLAESLDLEVVTKDMEKAQKTAKDAGAASSGMSTGEKATSPLPKSQTSRMGAKPVETGKGGHTGYALETAPKSADAGLTNRRKKAADGSSSMASGNYGAKKVSGSKLETTASEFHTDSNKMSPLSKGGQNLK